MKLLTSVPGVAAVSALVKALRDEDEEPRNCAAQSPKKIDPEAAKEAGVFGHREKTTHAATLIVVVTLALSPATAAPPTDYPRSVSLSADTPEPAYVRLRLAAADRAELVVHEWAPPQRAAGKPVILFVHG